MSGTIRHEILDDGIARVVLDHEPRLNAINNAMWDELSSLFERFDADSDLRCIMITGAGEKAFSTGADISEFEENRSTIEKARAYAKRTHGALRTIQSCRHPVIAEIRGLCVGGGLETALCADLRIAGKSARFGIPVKRLGLVVAYDEMRGLVETVGRSNSLRILLEGDIFGAEEALGMGLINRVVEDAQVAEESLATAKRIAEGAPLVARWHKKFARRLMDPAPLTAEENDESFTCFGTEDFQIGYRAFLDKKKPAFTGR
ncbi:enoyl-CoA hydratase/isomerase family protein [Aquibaculum arenosum]|uniref:Enoyl-CoA hydratase-related protein n=1 Tax=Aquibaculum arenosum TaxID=3032591 RepID=A0ABT5YQI7_9PROT|nr:enoyl-CoA hydratase-related protein [Fodinicurvata sp. CAU 1616]MDF2096459.1 enoyl-CoA hydratase-related protein [Fodinicurvata sp. CAU 1616]